MYPVQLSLIHLIKQSKIESKKLLHTHTQKGIKPLNTSLCQHTFYNNISHKIGDQSCYQRNTGKIFISQLPPFLVLAGECIGSCSDTLYK